MKIEQPSMACFPPIFFVALWLHFVDNHCKLVHHHVGRIATISWISDVI